MDESRYTIEEIRAANRRRAARLWARRRAKDELARSHPGEYQDLVTEFQHEYERQVSHR